MSDNSTFRHPLDDALSGYGEHARACQYQEDASKEYGHTDYDTDVEEG